MLSNSEVLATTPQLQLASVASVRLVMAMMTSRAAAEMDASRAATVPFPIFWNVDERAEPRIDVTKYSYTPRNYTQVGKQCAADPPPHSNTGCQAWTQGRFPTIDDSGAWIDGGVPQNADLAAHLDNIRSTLPQWIPDPNWHGNAVLDFEAWSTVWELNHGSGHWHGERYRDASRLLVARAHPSWSAAAVEAAAKRAFEAAATQWFVKTLDTCRALRPKARWGFYGLPKAAVGDCVGLGAAMRCGYDGPQGAALRAQAEVAQLPIWKASDALYPSIYIPHSMEGKPYNVSAYIRSTVGEAVRCARLGSKNGVTKPVLPYGWDHFHAPPRPPLRLPTDFVVAQLQISASKGAGGVIMWGSSAVWKNDSYWSWLEAEVAPAVHEWCQRHEGGC